MQHTVGLEPEASYSIIIFMSLEQEIKDEALGLGFDAVGITDASPLGSGHIEHFEAWLRSGYAGRMEYMHRNLDKRIDPARLRKGAKSVIVVALNYKPPGSIADRGLRSTDSAPHHDSLCATAAAIGSAPPTTCRAAETTDAVSGFQSAVRNPKSGIEPGGKVALYAQYEDYHLFIKALLRELASFISMKTGWQDRYKICVDSAPLAEKALAVRAGLGFIGKNHLLIHPRLGPQILLGELVTTLELHADEPSEGICGECDRCTKVCPTGALRPDGFLDARRCISYLTQYGAPGEQQQEWNSGMLECWNNEGKTAQHSTIPVFQHLNPLRGWLFGCDDCLLACPFSDSAPARANRYFKHHPERATLNLQELLDLSPDAFEAKFHNSPMKRSGLETLQRNARLCLGKTA